ncbi:MAG: acylphosphatase [Pseudomonadota bacterium]
MATIRQSLVIRGELGGETFVPWIERHSTRLGLSAHRVSTTAERIELEVEGQPDLIDALEMGCLLGPIDVWVSSIERSTSTA